MSRVLRKAYHGVRKGLPGRGLTCLLILVGFAMSFLLTCSVPTDAKLVGCVLARFGRDDAVQVRLTTDQDGVVRFTIGANVIRFAVYAYKELNTGLLLVSGSSVEIDVFANGVQTDRCVIPVDQIPEDYEAFCCDEIPPTVTVTAHPPPNANGWNNETVTVTITADDGEAGSGIETISYRCPALNGGQPVEIGRDDMDPGADDRTAEISFSLGRYDGSGVYEIECWAVDGAGNESELESAALRLDFEAPTVELSTSSSDEHVTVAWAIDDELSGLSECAVTLTQGSQQRVLSSDSSGEMTLSPDTYGVGAFELTARGVDRAGNEATETVSIELTAQRCSITGWVVDATNDEPITGALVVLSPTDRWVRTDSQGRFSFDELAPDTYVVEASKEDEYNTGSRTVSCVPSETSSVKLALSAVGDWRIVLSWNDDPEDLDSHLWTPEEHVYWEHTVGEHAQLDHDDTTGGGPETITILEWTDGIYTYAVKHYRGSETLRTSGAQVELYSSTSNTPLRRFVAPPCSTGTGTWWVVFRLHVSGGEVVEVEYVNGCLEVFDEESAVPPNPEM